jgi:hypothetical protein
MKTRIEPTPDLFPAEEMPFNLAGETLPEMTSEEWESYCHAFKEENRRKIRETHTNRNSTSPFNR